MSLTRISLKHDGTANTDGTAIERADETANTWVALFHETERNRYTNTYTNKQ